MKNASHASDLRGFSNSNIFLCVFWSRGVMLKLHCQQNRSCYATIEIDHRIFSVQLKTFDSYVREISFWIQVESKQEKTSDQYKMCEFIWIEWSHEILILIDDANMFQCGETISSRYVSRPINDTRRSSFSYDKIERDFLFDSLVSIHV